MKLSRYHFTLISILGLLLVINVAILNNESDKNNVGIDPNKSEALVEAAAVGVNSDITIQGSDVQDKQDTVSILHFGDAMFDRNVRKRMSNGTDPFSSIRELNILNDYEIRMLNLEGPIIEMDRKKCQQKAYNFQFASNTARMLKEEGFTAVTIANNHIYDCYAAGASSTIKYLNEAGLDIVGAPPKYGIYKNIVTSNGKKVAMVGIDTTINPPPTKTTLDLISELKQKNDVVLVTMHSGVEYAERATKAQTSLAHSFIDSGADVVIGHHPHVVENMEMYKNGIIFYSLGNFIFDQIGEKENEGVGVGMKIENDSKEILLYPYNIINSVPTFKDENSRDTWCAGYFKSSNVTSNSNCSLKIFNTQKVQA